MMFLSKKVEVNIVQSQGGVYNPTYAAHNRKEDIDIL